MVRTSYQMLACDLDGTILQHNRKISERVKRAIQLARKQDVRVALATGRSFQSALPHAEALGVDVPLICFQGGIIQHPVSGETLRIVPLPPELVEETIDVCQDHDWHLILYMADEIVLTEYRYPKSVYFQMLGPTFRQIADLREVIASGPIKLTVFADEADIPTVEKVMCRRFAGRMEIFRSHPMFVEGIPMGTSKGTALAWLADHLGITQAEVMAIGDQDNDASMIAWAGLGVAMGNGSKLCKNSADWIAPTIDDDGSAFAIERFLL